MPAKGKGPDVAVLRWLAWAIGLLALGSAFLTFTPERLRGIHWVLAVFTLLEAGIAIGRGRRTAFFVYAAFAVLLNPVRPFSFAPQIWRLLHAAAGIWLIGDHVPRRK